MFDIYYIGQLLARFAFLSYLGWFVYSTYKNRSVTVKKVAIFAIVCMALLSIGSAYRPKNTITTTLPSSFQQKASAEIKKEEPRIPSVQNRIDKLEKERNKKLTEIEPLMSEIDEP